jgi:hypothetical protein
VKPVTISDIGFIAALIPAGEKVVLAGDRAVEFWVEVLGIRSEPSRYFHDAIEHEDFQLLGTPRAGLALARAAGGTARVATIEDGASQTTVLVTANRDCGKWSAEFVSGLRGISREQLEQVRGSAMPVVLVPGRQTPVLALHPVHCLREQLEITFGDSPGRRREPNGEYHRVCVDLVIEACRRITLRHLKEGYLTGAIRIVEAVHEITLRPTALRARLLDGVRVEDAIVESDALPKEFRRTRLRHLRRVHRRKVNVYRRRFSHLLPDSADAASQHLLSTGSS